MEMSSSWRDWLPWVLCRPANFFLATAVAWQSRPCLWLTSLRAMESAFAMIVWEHTPPLRILVNGNSRWNGHVHWISTVGGRAWLLFPLLPFNGQPTLYWAHGFSPRITDGNGFIRGRMAHSTVTLSMYGTSTRLPPNMLPDTAPLREATLLTNPPTLCFAPLLGLTIWDEHTLRGRQPMSRLSPLPLRPYIT